MKISSKIFPVLFIAFFLIIGALLVGCAKSIQQVSTQSNLTAQPLEPIVLRSSDYTLTVSDGVPGRDVIIPVNEPITFLIVNNRSTASMFQIPQLAITAKLGVGQSISAKVVAPAAGYYQMRLNAAPYATIQAK